MFNVALLAAAIIGGVIASLAGFGVGSVLTPTLAVRIGMTLAVPVVAIPHIIGTALRFWFLRKQLDRHVLLTFGVASAIGGLIGAVLQTWIASRLLAYLLAALLICAGLLGTLGIELKFGKRGALAAGALSGALGGLVGNQGGIRAGAMLGFNVPKEAFVATSTAVALFIDGMRLPVYLYNYHRELASLSRTIVLATIGVIIGTIAGRFILGRISEEKFKRVVSVLILGLGISMLFV